jgi:hypothetical protein
MNIADGGFVYFVASSTKYCQSPITEQSSSNSKRPFLAWYIIFYDNTSCIICSSNGLYCLKFSDEFNVDGAPDATNGAMI